MRRCRTFRDTCHARLMNRLTISLLFAAYQCALPAICHAQAESASETKLNNALIEYVIGNKKKALELLTPLANNGSSTAQLVLWRLYVNFSNDCRSGLSWLEKSAQAGNAEAAYELGKQYLRGDCIEANASIALHWFVAADKNDYPEAASRIGEIYLRNTAAGPDYAAALQWFMRGATLYDTRACFHMGELYRDGLGVEPDDVEAFKWFDLSVEFASKSSDEFSKALTARDRIRERLTPPQVASAISQALSLWEDLVSHKKSSDRISAQAPKTQVGPISAVMVDRALKR
jgi:TPR repeat protein